MLIVLNYHQALGSQVRSPQRSTNNNAPNIGGQERRLKTHKATTRTSRPGATTIQQQQEPHALVLYKYLSKHSTRMIHSKRRLTNKCQELKPLNLTR